MTKRRQPEASGRRPDSSTKTSRRPGVELARTWLITVINPLLQGFRREETWWLTRKNWTWRYSTGRFEHLWPADQYVDADYRDNLTEFCTWYPQARQRMKEHDVALGKLAESCGNAFRSVVAANDFTRALQEAEAVAAQKGIPTDDARGAVPMAQWPQLVAEYLINNILTLPSHYTSAAFWNEAGPTVSRIREAESLRATFQAVDESGASLLKATVQAQSELVSVRQEYTRRYGLPPVPLSGPSGLIVP